MVLSLTNLTTHEILFYRVLERYYVLIPGLWLLAATTNWAQ